MSVPRDESLRKREGGGNCTYCGEWAPTLASGECYDCFQLYFDDDYDTCPECGRTKEVGEPHCFECEQDLWRERHQGDDLEPYENDL